MAEDQVFQQDLDQEMPDFHKLIWMQLLFREAPERPSPQAVQDALAERFGEVDTVSTGGIYSYAVRRFPVEYNNGTVPAQVLMGEPAPFSQDKLDAFQRSQLWDLEDKDSFLAQFHYGMLLSDFMASGLPYKERCQLLTGWLETALALFPTAIGVWVPSSGKLLERDRVLNNPLKGEDRFLWFGVNVRFFNIQDSDDVVMDTLGMYAIGLPDVQLHFHGLDPNAAVNYLYNIASYLYDNDAPVKSGETIDGVDPSGTIRQDIQWTCQYEKALIQPPREVMDICPGPYAAGRRNPGGKKGKKF